MDTLAREFSISSRDEVVALCKQIAEIMYRELEQNPKKNRPIIISLQSRDNAGKSAFWDIIREHLFIKGGIFVKKHSSSSQESGRVYETWVGKTRPDGRDIRLLNCNVGALMYEHMALFSINTFYKILGKGTDIPQYDIIILSKSDPQFIEPTFHTLEISICDLGGNYPKNWLRKIEYITPKGSPFSNLFHY
ncbi:MAG TPA: hypothetical protein PLK85_02425 [Alphaproteobacteria bacterium]|nr:hypothetical protein [Alphaproteobacteria bacterium]